jgi:hypothetical protein
MKTSLHSKAAEARAKASSYATEGWAGRGALVLCALLLLAIAFTPMASAFPNRFGVHYLQPPCCSGDPVNGTRASIRVQSITPDDTHCLAFRSDAENQASSWLIQAGLVRCGPHGNADGTCSLSNNLVLYVEVESGLNNFACFPHGAGSLNTQYKMTVDQPQPASDGWSSFIDGVPYERNGFVQYVIAESSEHTGTDSCSGSWSAFGAFAESTVWQRWIKSSLTWYTVQSDYLSAGCWIATSGPPGAFYFSR